MTKLYIISLAALSIASVPLAAESFTPKLNNHLTSDGVDKGLDSYALIQKAFGRRAIESPDLYDENHNDLLHIIEDEDDIVGPHFIFLAHRDDDKDRDKDFTDRQRNEIKVYDKSNDSLKAYENEVMQYRWKFKIDDGFEFSKNFTHFFQIKAKNVSKNPNPKDSDKFPILTISSADKGALGNIFQLRHSPSLDENGNRSKFQSLVQKDMTIFTGQWIEFLVQISYKEEGQLIFQAKNLESGELLVDYKNDTLDMWRGEADDDFSRPKWAYIDRSKIRKACVAQKKRRALLIFLLLKALLNKS